MSDQNANLGTRLVITPCTVQHSGIVSFDGYPLRARVTLAFTGFKSTEELKLRANRSSHDIEPAMWLAFPPLR